MTQPDWLEPRRHLLETPASPALFEAALEGSLRGPRALAALLAPVTPQQLERMALRARALTRQHFGRAITLYAPLYLSNHCSGGCAYCGFAADRQQPRHRLELEALDHELEALLHMGLGEVLLLTGERTPEADFEYLRQCVQRAARWFPNVLVEAFPMDTREYAALVRAGCTGVTLYQETYQPETYARYHRWGPKRDYAARLEAPARALEAGMRTIGLGALLGLADPVAEAIALLLHAEHLQRIHWRSGITISFPRLRPETGAFQAPHPVSDEQLAQMIFAFRLCLPEVPLVLSTRESPAFRQGIAGLGINKMSVASRTTVGGYQTRTPSPAAPGQFDVHDNRPVGDFCRVLRARGLEPVFKDWDAIYQGATP